MFTEDQLVSFGQYLLSEEREKRIKSTRIRNSSIKNRMRDVHHADFENWLAKEEMKRKQQKSINQG